MVTPSADKAPLAPLARLFTVFVTVHTIQKQRRGERARTLHVRLAVIASDETGADAAARAWFAREKQGSTWSVRFGSGAADAIVADLGEVWVREESDGVAVIS